MKPTKSNHIVLTLALLTCLSTLNSQLSTAFAQGSLTPPGAPAPTMKTLDQVYARLDSRTAITNANSAYLISAPGSYYLTTNLTVSSGNGININANGVTLDLNGFTISSTLTPASYAGISLNGYLNDINIVNGHIRSGVTNNGSGVYSGSGFATGIGWTSCSPTNVMVSKVSVSGVLNYGIYLGYGNAAVVEACTVITAGNFGILASTIKDSVVADCGGNAISGDQVVDCRGIGAGNGVIASAAAQNCYGQSGGSGSYYGVYVSGTAQNCYGTNSSSGAGLSATTAQNCYGASASGTGLYSTVAIGCYGYSSSGTGLWATIANSCIIGHGTTNITYKYNMP
jgi:hypothetical protein